MASFNIKFTSLTNGASSADTSSEAKSSSSSSSSSPAIILIFEIASWICELLFTFP